jgi:hypothetical protein
MYVFQKPTSCKSKPLDAPPPSMRWPRISWVAATLTSVALV